MWMVDLFSLEVQIEYFLLYVDCRKKKLLLTSLPTLTWALSDPSGDEVETSGVLGPLDIAQP